MVDWPWENWVIHKRCSSNGADECVSHLDCSPSNPRSKGVAMSLMEVHVELPNYLLYHRVVIFHHISPTLGLQHCLHSRGVLIKLCHLYSSLNDNYALTIVEVETALNLIFSKACPVIDEVLILLVNGSAGLSNRPLGVVPLSMVSSAPTSSITTSGSDLIPWAS
jgi:hypothetical protein